MPSRGRRAAPAAAIAALTVAIALVALVFFGSDGCNVTAAHLLESRGYKRVLRYAGGLADW